MTTQDKRPNAAYERHADFEERCAEETPTEQPVAPETDTPQSIIAGLRAERASLTRERDLATWALRAKVDDEHRLLALLEKVKAERDNAMSIAASRLLNEGQPVGLVGRMLDLANKWRALGSDGRDKRSGVLLNCAAELRRLAEGQTP